MTRLRKILATTRFEFRRSLTWQRGGATMVLALFPPAMLLIILLGGGDEFSILATCTMVLFVGLLALLLWATPIVHSELEGCSWAYVASRESGRYAILLGKYLNAVIWSNLVGLIATTTCAIVMQLLNTAYDPTRAWFGISLLVLLASPVYAAIFSMLGVIFSRRSMVFGAGYILLFEFLLASLPANVAKLTARYHLQAIAFDILGWFVPVFAKAEWEIVYGSTWWLPSLLALFLLTAVPLGVAAVVIRWREFILSDEAI